MWPGSSVTSPSRLDGANTEVKPAEELKAAAELKSRCLTRAQTMPARNIVAEIGRLALQLGGGRKDASSPLKRKVVQALDSSKNADSPSVGPSIASSMLSSPLTRVLEENAKLKRDIMQAKREVLRCKMELQEEKIRRREVEGRQVLGHPSVPWNKRKAEMQQTIDELQSELSLSRKAHKLHSRNRNDKLRTKLLDVESKWRESSKKNFILTQENDKLKEAVVHLEAVVESMGIEKETVLQGIQQRISERISEQGSTPSSPAHASMSSTGPPSRPRRSSSTASLERDGARIALSQFRALDRPASAPARKVQKVLQAPTLSAPRSASGSQVAPKSDRSHSLSKNDRNAHPADIDARSLCSTPMLSPRDSLRDTRYIGSVCSTPSMKGTWDSEVRRHIEGRVLNAKEEATVADRGFRDVRNASSKGAATPDSMRSNHFSFFEVIEQ